MISMHPKKLVVIVGPTAVGKTQVSIDLASSIDAEILSADSRQFYKEMNIGTAKPTSDQLLQVKHYFINTLSVEESYDAGKYEKESLEILSSIFTKFSAAVLVGGSGLYVDAVLKGFDDQPASDPSMRKELNEYVNQNGLVGLLSELQEKDPVYFNQVDKSNPVRIIRAIEVIRSTGKPFSHFRQGKKDPLKRPFSPIKIGLELPREELYTKIDQRMDIMIQNGLFDEVESLWEFKNKNALQTVGYTEIFGFIEGKYDREEAIRLLKRNSRRYAKRQLTWFKRDHEIRWFFPHDYKQILEYVENKLDT